ncbi:MAG: hypothetical protein ABID79_04160 [Elusimicrobiota bacterium]
MAGYDRFESFLTFAVIAIFFSGIISIIVSLLIIHVILIMDKIWLFFDKNALKYTDQFEPTRIGLISALISSFITFIIVHYTENKYGGVFKKRNKRELK